MYTQQTSTANSITTNYLFPILAFFCFSYARAHTHIFSLPFHMLLESVFIFWILKWITIFIIIKQKLWEKMIAVDCKQTSEQANEARAHQSNDGSQRKWNGNAIEWVYWLHQRNVSKGVRQLNILTSDKNVEWRSAESNSSHITCDNKNAIESDRWLEKYTAEEREKRPWTV